MSNPLRPAVLRHLARALLAAALIGCAGVAPVPAEFADPSPIVGGQQVVLGVHGLACPLCANNIDLQLLAVPGVRDVAVDMQTGLVTVTLAEAPRPSRRDLANAVSAGGFTLVSLEPR